MSENKELTKTQLSEIKMVFKSFDKDGDGSIDVTELKSALQRLGVSANDKNVQAMIKEVDTNKNGKIEADEFLNMVKDLKEGRGGELAKTLEKKGEIKGITTTSGGSHSYSDFEVEAFSQHINGVLSSDEDLKNVIPIQDDKALFEAVKDGVLLCKLINASKEGTIDERVINKDKLNDFKKTENHNLAINSAKGIGCQVINVGAGDLLKATPHIVLGLLWQVIKIGLLSDINLKECPELLVLLEEGENIKDMLKKSPEELLKRWFNYQLKQAGSERRVANFGKDISDSECYAIVLKQITKGKTSTSCNDEKDLTKRAELFLEEAEKADVRKFVDANAIVKGNQKLNLAFVATLFNTYPALEPVNENDYAGLLDFDTEGSREERSFRFWMQSLGFDVTNLYDDLSNGVLLLKLENLIQPGCVPEKKINDPPKNAYAVLENCKLAIEVAKNLKLSIINIGADDIKQGTPKLVLAIVWQLMRLQILNILKELGGGNAVTENDMIDWANKKVESTGLKIDSFKDKSLGTGAYLCQLCYAINPKACNPDLITNGDSKEEAEQNAKYAISVARKLGATVFLLWEDIVEVKPKMILTFIGGLMILEKGKKN